MNSFQFKFGSHNLLKSCSFERQATRVLFSDGVVLTSANYFTPGHSLFQGRIGDCRPSPTSLYLRALLRSLLHLVDLDVLCLAIILRAVPQLKQGKRWRGWMERMKQVAPSKLSIYIDCQILTLSCHIIISRSVWWKLMTLEAPPSQSRDVQLLTILFSLQAEKWLDDLGWQNWSKYNSGRLRALLTRLRTVLNFHFSDGIENEHWRRTCRKSTFLCGKRASWVDSWSCSSQRPATSRRSILTLVFAIY